MRSGLRVEIFPHDLDRTVHFYRDVLGFAVMTDERGRASEYVSFERDDVRVGAARRPPRDSSLRRPPLGVELVLEVDDVEDVLDHVRDQAWPIDEDLTERPWGLSDFRLLDPDGHYWRVTGFDNVRRPAAPARASGSLDH